LLSKGGNHIARLPGRLSLTEFPEAESPPIEESLFYSVSTAFSVFVFGVPPIKIDFIVDGYLPLVAHSIDSSSIPFDGKRRSRAPVESGK
jgi:hypothetical protein